MRTAVSVLTTIKRSTNVIRCKGGRKGMRHQGFISKVISDYLVLVQDSNGKFWRIISSDEVTRLGGHHCELQNAAVTFDFDGQSVTDFQIDAPDFDLAAKEESTIIYTRREHTPCGGFGFMRRIDCGCSIHFSRFSVVTWGDIKVGAEARHRVGVGDGRAVAEEIELFQQ
jgi:hypothetical protein